MTVTEISALIVAIATVVTAVFLITAVNNLNNTMAKLEDTAHQLRDEGIAAFRDLRQLISDADAELDKVDLVLDRADQATTHITETTRRTHEAVQDPMIRTLAVASGTGRVAKSLLFGKKKNRDSAGASEQTIDVDSLSSARPVEVPGSAEPLAADTGNRRRRFRLGK